MATKTTTKTKTATLLAQKLKVQNIVQMSLVQTTLQNNFEAIIQALSQQDEEISKNEQQTKNNQHKIDSVISSQDTMNNQLKQLKQMIKSLTQENSNMKLQILGIQSKSQPNPESTQSQSQSSYHISQQMQKQIAGLKQKLQKMQEKSGKGNQFAKSQIEKVKKQLNDIKKLSQGSNLLGSRLKQLQKLINQIQNNNKDIESKLSNLEKGDKAENSADMLQKFNQLEQKVSNISQDNTKLNQRLEQLQKQLQDNKNIMQQQRRARSKLGQQLWKLHDSIAKVSQSNLSHQMNSDVLKQLKKQIADLQKKINQLSGSSLHSKIGFNDTTTHQSPSKYNLQSAKSENGNYGDLREELLERLKQLRSDLMKNMKRIDMKSDGDSGIDKNRLDAVDEAILRLDHILSDKANLDTVKKLIANVQNKIGYIYNMFLGDSEQDARIARKNWFCLSCDKGLDKYQGKLGNHLINAQLKTKTLDQDTVGGGMVLKPSKSKVDLPKVFNNNMAKKL